MLFKNIEKKRKKKINFEQILTALYDCSLNCSVPRYSRLKQVDSGILYQHYYYPFEKLHYMYFYIVPD